MTIFLPTILLAQFLVSAIYGWKLGVQKGIGASSITILIVLVIALAFSGMWIFMIILVPFLLIASGMGATAGVAIRNGEKRRAILLIGPLIAYWIGAAIVEVKKDYESRSALEFVKSNAETISLAGDKRSISLSRVGVTKYEFYVTGQKEPKGFNVTVDVSKSWWGESATYSLACVTFSSPDKRDSHIKTCK